MNRPWHQPYALLLLLTYCVFPAVSQTIFQVFSCDSDFDDGQSFLRLDYSIKCQGPTYNFFFYYAIAMIFVYPIGVPLFYAVSLWRVRKVLDPSPTRLAMGVRDVLRRARNDRTARGAEARRRKRALAAGEKVTDKRAATKAGIRDEELRRLRELWEKYLTLGKRECPVRGRRRMGRGATFDHNDAGRGGRAARGPRHHAAPGARVLLRRGAAVAHDVSAGVRTASSPSRTHRPTSRLLFQPYKPSYYYWEVVESARRLVLGAVLVVLFPRNQLSQVAFGLVAACAVALFQARFNPYHAASRFSLAARATPAETSSKTPRASPDTGTARPPTTSWPLRRTSSWRWHSSWGRYCSLTRTRADMTSRKRASACRSSPST